MLPLAHQILEALLVAREIVGMEIAQPQQEIVGFRGCCHMTESASG
jgi:hypothetical protein